MAIIDDLVSQIQDEALRDRISNEIKKQNKTKKFGLVFEEHLPECTPLYDLPIKVGSEVALKAKEIKEIYIVLSIKDEKVKCCLKNNNEEIKEFEKNELVRIVEFGDPIYPYLKPIDSVCNNPDSDLWHTLIEADNYHALQLLEYLYAGKVDCIYIDPPYNTRDEDWKYNNNYVDKSDSFKHSKWLSMMKKRLQIASKLLNPDSGVLIVTIDEHEVHNLGLLLEQIFPNAFIQMVTSVINPKGVSQGKFARVEENIYFVFMQNAKLSLWNDPMLGEVSPASKVRWAVLLRSGSNAQREDRPKMYYPILIDETTKKVIKGGEILPLGQHPNYDEKIDGYTAVWPIRTDLSEGHWSVNAEKLNQLIECGYVSLGGYDKKRGTWAITYLSEKTRKQIDNGDIAIVGKNEQTGVVEVEYAGEKNHEIRTVWNRQLHNAGTYGSDVLKSLLGEGQKFPYPKSIYAEHDTLGIVLKDNPNALVLDFFAGSGTTLNAINLLNYEDGGKRRCILVTNNECFSSDEKDLAERGLCPSDAEWEEKGICRSVTWPRTKNSIKGETQNGSKLDGYYYVDSYSKVGIKRNYYKIDFLEENELTKKTKEGIIKIIGVPNGTNRVISTKENNSNKITIKNVKEICSSSSISKALLDENDNYLISEESTSAIIFNLNNLDDFISELKENDQITDIYIVSKKDSVFKETKKKIDEEIGDSYYFEQDKIQMSDGFKTNANYYKLGFLDKTSIALGKQFKELLPILWMKAGAIGECPKVTSHLPKMLVLPKNKFAVLIDEDSYNEFTKEVDNYEIDTIYFVTDSDNGYKEMIAPYRNKETYQLYKDYLDNFRINVRRN